MPESELSVLPRPAPAAASATLHIALPVLGIPVQFSTNAADVLAIVDEAFGVWRGLPPADVAADVRASVVIMLHEGEDEPGQRLAHRLLADDRLLICSRGSRGIADPARREAMARVTPALLRDRENFRYGMLEALTLALLTRLDRQPFHAAALVRRGTSLLLHGPSGAGKSTLALAASRAGLTVLSEGTVFLQRAPRLRVWGMPSPIHLREAPPPSLAGRTPAAVRTRDGITKFALPAHTDGLTPRLRACERHGLCVLAERRAMPLLRRVGAAEALAALDLRRDSGFAVFADSIRPLIEDLVRSGAWILHPSPDPLASVPLLRCILDELSAIDASMSDPGESCR